jgi:auxin efflux carrier family protein
LKGLHWDKIPGDNDEEVAARGILYLLIFQQLGQLVRWSWGYHILLAPREKYEVEGENATIEEGRSANQLTDQLILGLDGDCDDDNEYDFDYNRRSGLQSGTGTVTSFDSGGRTPVNTQYLPSGGEGEDPTKPLLGTPVNGNNFASDRSNGNLTSFPTIRSPTPREEQNIPAGIRGWIPMARLQTRRFFSALHNKLESISQQTLLILPTPLQTFLRTSYRLLATFFCGLWEFMNPPLWAMLIAIFVASIPKLQHLFFAEGSFIANSVTRAIGQSGGVAVPLILVVLGANLARNTLPKSANGEDSEENKIGTKLLVASLISRMLLPTIVMAPILALIAKYVPVSIVDDPIFVIVCFLLTGAPSALQLAQICQINVVYEGVMSKLLFQSYVVWYVYFPYSETLLTALGSSLRPLSLSCVRLRLWSGQTARNRRDCCIFDCMNNHNGVLPLGSGL